MIPSVTCLEKTVKPVIEGHGLLFFNLLARVAFYYRWPSIAGGLQLQGLRYVNKNTRRFFSKKNLNRKIFENSRRLFVTVPKSLG